MRESEKFGTLLLAVLLLMLPLIAACSDDDDTAAATPITAAPTEPATAAPTEPAPAVPTEPAPAVPTEPAPAVPTEPAPETPTPEPEDVNLTIGVLADLTGPAANALADVGAAMEDLVEYFNTGDFAPGVELELLFYDTAYDPSKDVPGYEWLKERGADLFFTGLPPTPITLYPSVADDEIVLFAATHNEEVVDPPGWVFCIDSPLPASSITLLNWIAENDWDYETNGPAKIGAADWVGAYGEYLQAGIEQYCTVHPEQFEWVGAYNTLFVPTWGPEVTALVEAECDYIMPPSVGYGLAGFVKEYRDAGGTAKLIGTVGQASALGMLLDLNGWEAIDGMLFIHPNRWWNEDAEIPNLANQLLNEYHDSGGAEAIKGGGMGYLAAVSVWWAPLQILAETINSVGAENFTSQSLYDTTEGFAMTYGGNMEWDFSETKRTSWNYLGIYRASAAEGDLVRADPEWLPILYTP